MHADQAGVMDRARVHDGGVTDRDVGTDDQRKTGVGVFAGVGHVQDRAVLHIRARTDADVMHVTARDDTGPQRSVLANLDVADHLRRRVDVDVGADARYGALVGSDVHGTQARWFAQD